MKKFDQLTKIYLENVSVPSGPITLKELANNIYRLYEILDPNAKTKSGEPFYQLKELVDALIEARLID